SYSNQNVLSRWMMRPVDGSGKCVAQTITLLSQYRSRKLRRVVLASVGSKSAHDPSRFQTLHGAVDAISGNDRLSALRSQVNADMARGMGGSGFQPDFVVKCKVATDELRLARLHGRQDAVQELRLRVLPVQRLKAFPFAPGEDVLRVRERA